MPLLWHFGSCKLYQGISDWCLTATIFVGIHCRIGRERSTGRGSQLVYANHGLAFWKLISAVSFLCVQRFNLNCALHLMLCILLSTLHSCWPLCDKNRILDVLVQNSSRTNHFVPMRSITVPLQILQQSSCICASFDSLLGKIIFQNYYLHA